MTKPLITTIIPTFRRPQLLKRALTSALDQTYPHIQVCVYDNASGDETESVVNAFIQKDKRVKYCCHEKNIGMLGNYAFSLKEVNTPYFSFLSDDDVIFPWFYEEAMKSLKDFPRSAFFAGSVIIMTEAGKVVHVPFELWEKQGYLLLPDGLLEMIPKYPVPTCVLFNHELIKEISIDMDNALTWDCDFLLQISSQYPIYVSKRPCGIFLHHDSSYSNVQQLDHWQYALQRMMNRLQENEHVSERVKEQVSGLLLMHMKLMFRSFILRYLFSRKFEESINYAKLFKQKFGLSLETGIFLFAIPICKWFFPAFYGLFLLREIKKKVNSRSFRNYNQYAKWIR